MHPLEAQFQQARALMGSGKPAEAEAIFRRLLKRAPGDAMTQSQLARALARQGRRDEAAFFARRAGESKNPSAIEEAAHALGELGDDQGAVALLERAVTLNPAQASALSALAVWLQHLLRTDEARDAIERAHAAAPSDPAIAANLGLFYAETWSLEKGLDILRTARARHPDHPGIQYTIAFLSNYSDRVTREQILSDHRRHAQLLARVSSAAQPTPPPNDTDRPLRVGLLSPDFRETSVARFLEPIIREHDPAVVRYTLYPLNRQQDDTTARFRGWCESWSESAMLPDTAAAAAIRADQIDVLIDLCGLTRGMRAALLMARAAPVQITYLGYPNTTALPNVDYRIVDSITDPPGAEALATERLIRLDPCFLCFTPPRAAQTVPAHGPAGEGPVTFVSFNHLTKVTPTTLDLWTAILRQVPGSRLMLKATALSASGVRQRIGRALEDRGLGGRFELVPYAPDLADHCRLYHRADIALDTYPYHGTTTTCEALYMGMPVITLAGDRHASRVGASLLTAVGHPELIARMPDEYIAGAVDLAMTPARRTVYHATLRDRVMASPAGDAPRFARRFEAMLKHVWSQAASAPDISVLSKGPPTTAAGTHGQTHEAG